MPSTRRSSRGVPAKGAQSKLSFAASKRNSSIGKDLKSSKLDSTLTSTKSNLGRVESVDDVKIPEVVTLEDDKDTAKVKIGPKGKTSEVEKAETEAREVTEEEIQKWWGEKQRERIAPRVHQEGVSTLEKILRLFDMSSQYGPCIGIPRIPRWHRAKRLGLEPPIEVLAVMLQEEKGDWETKKAKGKDGDEGFGQKAHLEELLATKVGPDN